MTLRHQMILATSIYGVRIEKVTESRIEDIIIADVNGVRHACAIITHESEHIALYQLRVHNARMAALCIWTCSNLNIESLIVTNDRWPHSRCLQRHDSSLIKLHDLDCKEDDLPPVECNGVRGGDACCPEVCGKCGGEGCAARERKVGVMCCISHIKRSGRSCKKTTPPCIM